MTQERVRGSSTMLYYADSRLGIGIVNPSTHLVAHALKESGLIRRNSRRRVTDWWSLLAVLGASATVSVMTQHHQTVESAAIVTFFAATPTETRSVSLRLSGFDWVPYRNSLPQESSRSYIASAVGTVIAKNRGDTTPAARHTVGVAELLIGRSRQALDNLSAAAESMNDPRVWNDLSVAWYETAKRFDSPELLADALSAADRALVANATFREALFNRAAILGHLGLHDDARIAWERYLVHETNPDWSAEGRMHLRTLQPEVSFLETLDRNPMQAQALAQRDPQGARVFGTIEILARWATAVNAGDTVAAARHLGIARNLGASLVVVNGDRLLERAVDVIDAAEAATRSMLATAQLDYLAGRDAYRDNRPVDAEALLRRAVASFAIANSPLAFAARQLAAVMMYEQSRDAEALNEQVALLREVPRTFPALREHARWQVGVIHASAARWGDALPHLMQSSETFQRLGELDHRSRVERVIALVYDRTGDSAMAWKHRMIALRGIGRRSDLALEKCVATIAHAAIFAKKWHVAASLLSLEIDIARRISDEVQLADALIYRAAVREQLEDAAGASDDASDAEATIARVKDPAYRAYLHADALVLRARLESSPSRAEALISEAIRFLETKGDRMEIPSLLLHRARIARKGGNIAGAIADLNRGAAELEASRESLPQGEARWGAFHTDEELFEEAIDLLAQQNDAAGALAFAEKARARSLLDAYGHTPSLDHSRLAPHTIIVELVALPSRLILITADASGIRTASVNVNRTTIEAEARDFTHALRADDASALRRAGLRLHERLVQPLADRLAGAERIVFVPDAATAAISFAALLDRDGTYLLERYEIVVAPSAAFFVAALERRRDAIRPRSVLIVANAHSGAGGGHLSFVNAESIEVGAAYPFASALHGTELVDAKAVDVIHFAGHAVGDDSGLEPASILLRDGVNEKRMAVADIARLKLQRTSLVVLAGCNTARGERRSAEGVISVAHGFLTAGVPSVIATLWPIDDRASARFFPKLHRRLAEGLRPADALRSVQLESIQRKDVPASLWASLQDMGS